MATNIFRSVFRKIHAYCLTTPKKEISECGKNVVIEPYFHSKYPNRVKLGNHIYIGPYATFHSAGGITIEDGVIFGPHITIYTSNHNYLDPESLPFDNVQYYKPVIIKTCVRIGDGATILPGVSIGEGAVVGAGSVVTKNVPDFCIVGGNPANIIQ